MYAHKAITDARRLLGGEMESSARLCLAEAIEAYDAGRHDDATGWAIKSLRYSVGIASSVYQKHARDYGVRS